ncbi:MAG: hypothetical protein QNL12_07940 [Acidimicrobiia bacterium]|nr:hypothetical protein [Acidimicrobiia bacterium]
MKRLIALAVVAAVVAVYIKRPVKQPVPSGSWGPAEQQRTPR